VKLAIRRTPPAAVAGAVAVLFLLAAGVGAYALLTGGGPQRGGGSGATVNASPTGPEWVYWSSYSPCPQGAACDVVPVPRADCTDGPPYRCPTPTPCPGSACAPVSCQATNAGCPTPVPCSGCATPCGAGCPPPPTCDPRQANPRACPTPPPPGPTGGSLCAASEVDLTATTDHGSYSAGTAAGITATIHNHSNRSCSVPYAPDQSAMACTPAANITQDSTGRVVWYSRNPMIMAPCYAGETSLAPNQSLSQKWNWNEQTGCYGGYGNPQPTPCQTGAAPAGSYTVHVSWVVEATHQFKLA
jgi:hypothetical protein